MKPLHLKLPASGLFTVLGVFSLVAFGAAGAASGCAGGASGADQSAGATATSSGSGGSASSGHGGMSGATTHASSSTASSSSSSSSATTASGEGGHGGAGGAGHGGSGGAGGAGQGGGGGKGPICGDGVKDGDEECDGADFGGQTCKDFGFAGGKLVCNQFCNLVVSGCTPPEDCNSPNDVDKDGLAGCQDPACKNAPNCLDSCLNPTVLMNGAFQFDDNTGKGSTLKPSCVATPGPEFVYSYTVTQNQAKLALKLTPFANNLDLGLSVRTTCKNDASEIACAHSGGPGAVQTLSLPLAKGTAVTIIVAGADAKQFGSYELDLNEVTPEILCSNYLDDDLNTFTDCADSNCQKLADCNPGAMAIAGKCTKHSDCAALRHDPLCIDEADYGWKGGYCSEICDLKNPSCPAGSVCADTTPLGGMFVWGNGLGACLKTCAKLADCPSGYMCADFGAGFVCKQ